MLEITWRCGHVTSPYWERFLEDGMKPQGGGTWHEAKPHMLRQGVEDTQDEVGRALAISLVMGMRDDLTFRDVPAKRRQGFAESGRYGPRAAAHTVVDIAP